MVFIVVAAVGLIAARWLNWFSVVAIAIFLAVAVGVEGAIHFRPFLKVLKRCFEMNAAFQGAYFAEGIFAVYGPRLLARSSK